jgi:hypothetical protein
MWPPVNSLQAALSVRWKGGWSSCGAQHPTSYSGIGAWRRLRGSQQDPSCRSQRCVQGGRTRPTPLHSYSPIEGLGWWLLWIPLFALSTRNSSSFWALLPPFRTFSNQSCLYLLILSSIENTLNFFPSIFVPNLSSLLHTFRDFTNRIYAAFF